MSPDRRAVEPPADERERRIAQVLVQPRHRPGVDPALEAVAGHEVVPFTEPLDERLELREVIAVVGVAHDHPAAASSCDSAGQSRAVAALLDRNDARSELLGDLLRPVGRSVVGDHDLARDADPLERIQRLADADPDRLRLVQAWHHDRELRNDLGHRRGARLGGAHVCLRGRTHGAVLSQSHFARSYFRGGGGSIRLHARCFRNAR